MKREFSFYEFVGILVPGVTLLFFTEILFEIIYSKTIIDFSKIGESLVFFIIAYGFGHILQSIGNAHEWLIWKIYDGKPSSWLTKPSRFNQKLFDEPQAKRISDKIIQQFGEIENKDYGKSVYVFLASKSLTNRSDIFNGNYSLFRGLTIVFFILGIMVAKYIDLYYSIWPFIFFFLATARMIRFAKLYAIEIYLTYNNINPTT